MKVKDEVQWDRVDYGLGVFHVVSYGRAESLAPAKAAEPAKVEADKLDLWPLWRRLCCCSHSV